MTTFCAALALVVAQFLPTLHTEESWPMVDFAVVLNMALDGVAMIPQVLLGRRFFHDPAGAAR